MSEQINYVAVMFYGLLAAAIILAILYFLNTPIKPATDSAWAWVSTRLSGINLGSFDFGKLISDNIGIIVSSGIGGIMTIGTLLSLRAKKKENEALLEQYKQLNFEKVNLEGQKNALVTTLTDKESELKMYTGDQTAEILQTRMSTMKEGYERQITDLQAQVTKLQRDLESRPVINVTETRYK